MKTTFHSNAENEMEMQGDIIYRVNDADEIVFVNEEWDRFALANGGEAAASTIVLRRPMWDFVGDPTTRSLYRQVLTRVRAGKMIRFTFRCDSPAFRRLLEMSVSTIGQDTVQFRSRTVSEEERLPYFALGQYASRPDEFLRVCAWCKKVFMEGHWREIEEVVPWFRLFEQASLPSLTHGICEECYGTMTEALADP